MALWQVFLAKSSNLTRYGDISKECRGKSFSLGLNKAGSFNFNVPFDSEFTDYLTPKKYCAIVQKDKEIVWSGPIWTRETDFAAKKFNISCVGWFEMLQTRLLTSGNQNFEDTSDGDIAHGLLAIANAQTIGGTTIPTWISEGINTSSQTRTIEYEQYKSIGEAIQELSEMEAGFDFEVDPETRNLNIRAWHDFTTRSVYFAYTKSPKNLRNVVVSENGADQRNEYYVIGKHETARANDSILENFLDYGLHQEAITISDLGDRDIQAVIANAELAVHKTPIVSINIDAMGEGQAARSVPQLFTDYELGDKVFVSAHDPDTDIEINRQAVRIFGVNFEIDELGNEKVSSIQTTYST